MTETFTRNLVESSDKITMYDSFPDTDFRKTQDETKDKSKYLDLFCYNNCTNTDENYIKECRGVVFNNNKVILKSFPYTPEYSVSQVDTTINDLVNCSVFDAHEGTLIRLFYFNNKWFISTNKKLDAFKSKWSSYLTFGQIFKNALYNATNTRISSGMIKLEDLYKFLDKTKQFMFLVNSKENRIVCRPETFNLFHVGTYSNGVLDVNDDIGFVKPQKHDFKDFSELCTYVKSVDPFKLQGVIVFTKNFTDNFKVLNEDYSNYYTLRNNVPSIKFRYLQIRNNSEQKESLIKLYPENNLAFMTYESTIEEIAHKIHKSYIDRFINKKFIKVSQTEYIVIKDCHQWHMNDRVRNKVTLFKVRNVLNNQTPSNLNHMIKEHTTTENDKKE